MCAIVKTDQTVTVVVHDALYESALVCAYMGLFQTHYVFGQVFRVGTDVTHTASTAVLLGFALPGSLHLAKRSIDLAN